MKHNTLRGGSCSDFPKYCRSTSRDCFNPVNWLNPFGLRVVCGLVNTIEVSNMTDFNQLIETVKIESGSFMMGSSEDKDAYADEFPQHKVTIDYDFEMGKYPITQAQWRAVAELPKVEIELESDPSHFKGDDLPVDSITWHEAVEFCARLSAATGKEYRLPSEAEWEYACRAGTTTPYSFGEGKISEYAHHNSNATRNVGELKPNPWGLYDMHGNVWEWCQDDWHDDYNGAPTDGSAWIDG